MLLTGSGIHRTGTEERQRVKERYTSRGQFDYEIARAMASRNDEIVKFNGSTESGQGRGWGEEYDRTSNAVLHFPSFHLPHQQQQRGRQHQHYHHHCHYIDVNPKVGMFIDHCSNNSSSSSSGSDLAAALLTLTSHVTTDRYIL